MSGSNSILRGNTEEMSNEYYKEQWKKFRKSYDVKNKYHPIGQSANFQDYVIPATQWNDIPLWLQKIMRLEKRS